MRQFELCSTQLARSLAATLWEMLTKVIISGVVGHVLTGVRLVIGILWIVHVPWEILACGRGSVIFVLDTCDWRACSELMATILLIGLLGLRATRSPARGADDRLSGSGRSPRQG